MTAKSPKAALLAALLFFALFALPALAASGGLTVSGVISTVTGNDVSLNGGLVVLDVTGATIIGHSAGGSPGVAALVPGAPVLATIASKRSDGALVASTVLVGAPEAVELRGLLEAVDARAGTFRLLGVTVGTDPQTAYSGSTARGPVHGLADLAVGDKVEVEAVRSGSGLVARHVHAESDVPPDHTITFVGKVDMIGATSWTISGRSVGITPTTRITGSPAVGDFVKVKALVSGGSDPTGGPSTGSGGTLTALEIEKLNRPEPQLQQIRGTLEVKGSGSWTISGIVVKIASTTIIRNDPKVGDRIEGLARREADGSLTAIVLVGMGHGNPTGGGNDGGGHH